MAKTPTGRTRPDIASLAGLGLALAGVIGGLMLEGGRISDISQPTAAMIVLGGTVGAVMLSTPLSVCSRAARRLASVFFEHTQPLEGVIREIIAYATKARKTGVVSLEADAEQIPDPFLKKALTLAVDGADLQEIQRMMELEIDMGERRAEAEAKVFESAGGYAPTIGIIGAVLGLIQVMKHLANMDDVGRGIAVAFVATVYGVGSANIFFLPAGAKIRARAQEEAQRQELILEGVSGIVEGLNPKLIRSKLEAYCPPQATSAAKSQPAARVKAEGTRPVEA